jgi:hypothetical protein
VQRSEQELDQIILSSASAGWQKTAMLIVRSLDRMKGEDTMTDFETIAARIEALVRSGRLEAAGNLAKWRYSEVRLASTRSD